MGHFPTRIIFATDGSPDAVLAGRAAVDLANTTGPGLHIVHAWYPVLFYVHPSVARAPDPRPHERKARDLLNDQLERVKGVGGLVEGDHLRMGPPADEILEVAEELEAGLIVVGSRGLGTRGRIRKQRTRRLGSVSTKILRAAGEPVLVCRAD